jgi:hypothetical protein
MQTAERHLTAEQAKAIQTAIQEAVPDCLVRVYTDSVAFLTGEATFDQLSAAVRVIKQAQLSVALNYDVEHGKLRVHPVCEGQNDHK